jgi:hypothetical protein
MTPYTFNTENLSLTELNQHRYESEGNSAITPQNILAKYPHIITNIPELDINESEIVVVREFSLSVGYIDILMITDKADIILIETKLYRNPESHRTVVAQVIDYVKTMCNLNDSDLSTAFINSAYNYQDTAARLFKNDHFCSKLNQNLRSGNISVVIAGDMIHPNILGMVDSIQSAPHLAFTIYMVEILTYENGNELVIIPNVVTKTNEVERSVIRLEINHDQKSISIDSSAPEKESKGNKPKITQDDFLNSLSIPEFQQDFVDFWNKWERLGGDLNLGVTGFSAGFTVNGSRKPILYAYPDDVYLISKKHSENYNINNDVYNMYKEYWKNHSSKLYDRLVSNKVGIKYDDITRGELLLFFEASYEMVKELKKQ